MEEGVVARRRGAGIECHPDALALVVVPAAGDGPDVAGVRPEIACLHLGVSLEAARREDDATRMQVLPPRRRGNGHARDGAVIVAEERARRRLVAQVDAVRLGPVAERLDQGEPAADGSEARRRRRDEVARQEIEAEAERLEPGERRTGIAGERVDNVGVGHREGFREGTAVGEVTGGFRDQSRIEMGAGVGGEVGDEVVGDLGLAPHAHEGFGPARVAASILARGPLEEDHGGAFLAGGCRSREAGDAAADDDHVGPVARGGHVLSPDARDGAYRGPRAARCQA